MVLHGHWVVCLVSLAQMGANKTDDAASQETHVEEMNRLKLEIQQCKDFIQTQQQLLQVRLKGPLVQMDSIMSQSHCRDKSVKLSITK